MRKAVARFTYSWNGNLTEEDIVTTAGVTNAVALALSDDCQGGYNRLAVESPVYLECYSLPIVWDYVF